MMCSVFTHPAVPLALSACLPDEMISRTLLFAGVACSVIPDLDVIGSAFGVRYGDMLGHRGLTHSIAFAAALALLFALTLSRHEPAGPTMTFAFLFVSTLSHPLLDMLTNGGLGVALLAPFSDERFFFPWRPIDVSPIGFGFFSLRAIRVLASEVQWVWLPAAAVFLTAASLRRFG
jgi:inner membrane protein